MHQKKSHTPAFARRARALLMALPMAVVLVLFGVQPGYAQSDSDQQLQAVMAAISLLLLSECTDEDEDTLCDVDEIKYFGDLDQVAQKADGDNWDFDGDGISNGDELLTHRSNPNSVNSDGDLLGDYAELLIGTSLTIAFDSGATLGSNTPQDKATMHKLNRLTFGPTQLELDQVSAAGGIDNWILEQLIPIGIPPAPPRHDASTAVAPLYSSDIYPFPYDCDGYTTPDPAQKMRDCYVSRRHGEADIPASFRPMHSIKQLQSRMALFWDNHFNTDIRSHGRGMQELYDEDNWFLNAFGNFRRLLELNAKNYTMLEYLDLDDNRRSSPNENFPREIMELHSVGIDGGYVAEDTAQLAYILTGWDHEDVRKINGPVEGTADDLCINDDDIISCAPYVSRYAYRATAENDGMDDGMDPPETGEEESAKFDPLRIFLFKSNDHDDGELDYDDDTIFNDSKTLYAGTSNEITIGSQLGEDGQLEGEAALDFLANHPSTADFICTKLAQEFVADDPQDVTVDNCASVFLANPDDANQMGLVLASLLSSIEFNAPETQRNKLKDTQEVMFSLGRILGWDATHAGEDVKYYDAIASEIGEAEQPLLYKAEPTGYYETADNWLDTNIVLNRFQEMNDMVFNEKQTQSFVSYFNAIGKTSSGEIMAHLFLVMLGGHYDEHDVQMGLEILHKVDPDNPGNPELQAFDLADTTDVIRYHLGGGGNGIPDPDDRIRALIARLAALPQFHLH